MSHLAFVNKLFTGTDYKILSSIKPFAVDVILFIFSLFSPHIQLCVTVSLSSIIWTSVRYKKLTFPRHGKKHSSPGRFKYRKIWLPLPWLIGYS